MATYCLFPAVCSLIAIPRCHRALGGKNIFNLIKVALTSLLFCDLTFTESSIIAERTKTSFTKQKADKLHLKIGEEIAKLLEAKGTITHRNQ